MICAHMNPKIIFLKEKNTKYLKKVNKKVNQKLIYSFIYVLFGCLFWEMGCKFCKEN